MENLLKNGPLFREFGAQKPTHMGGTYPYPQQVMYPPPPGGDGSILAIAILLFFFGVVACSDENCSKVLKGSVSSSIPCTCRLLVGLCLPPFSWPMKMATTKANQEATRARHAGCNRPFKFCDVLNWFISDDDVIVINVIFLKFHYFRPRLHDTVFISYRIG